MPGHLTTVKQEETIGDQCKFLSVWHTYSHKTMWWLRRMPVGAPFFVQHDFSTLALRAYIKEQVEYICFSWLLANPTLKQLCCFINGSKCTKGHVCLQLRTTVVNAWCLHTRTGMCATACWVVLPCALVMFCWSVSTSCYARSRV